MRMLSQKRRRPNDHIDTIHTSLDRYSCIVHVTSDVGQDLGSLEAELANGFTVLARLLRRSWRGKLDVIGTELVECLSDFNLLSGVEVGIGKLLAFS